MKKNRVLLAVILFLLSIWVNGAICQAEKKVEISPFSYREYLLVSYKEYWYTDGAGVESHVLYNQQYRNYTFQNGYRQLSPTITILPITSELPHGTTRHQLVQLRYEFY